MVAGDPMALAASPTGTTVPGRWFPVGGDGASTAPGGALARRPAHAPAPFGPGADAYPPAPAPPGPANALAHQPAHAPAWPAPGGSAGAPAPGSTLQRTPADAHSRPSATTATPSRAALSHGPVTVARAVPPDSHAASAAAFGGGHGGGAASGGGGGGGASAAGAGSDAAYQDLLHRLREEQEQLGRVIQHPF